MTEQIPRHDIKKVSKVLSDIGELLLANGANSNRTARNLKRIASAYHYHIEYFFSYSGIILTVVDTLTDEHYTIVKRINGYGVNYSIISDVSILSWKVFNGNFPFDAIEKEIQTIKATSIYSLPTRLLFIALATVGLCSIFDGSVMEMIICFIATVIGFMARKFVQERKYNVYVSFLFAAFVCTSIVNLSRVLGMEDNARAALTVCVLWLIPGVPLINGFLDFLEGHVVSGWAKFSMAGLIIFMIAVGFYVSLLLFGYGGTFWHTH